MDFERSAYESVLILQRVFNRLVRLKLKTTIQEVKASDENETGRPLSKEEFAALTLEGTICLRFPILNTENWKDKLSRNDLDISQAIYVLRLKNLSGYMEMCHFCLDKRCEGCPLPFTDDLTFNDLLIKIGATSNVSFYNEGYKHGKQDVIIDIIWNNRIEKSFFDKF